MVGGEPGGPAEAIEHRRRARVVLRQRRQAKNQFHRADHARGRVQRAVHKAAFAEGADDETHGAMCVHVVGAVLRIVFDDEDRHFLPEPAATRSRFWKEMAIFVIEDDAQNGPDHVDAHRTVGFVISPFCKRGFVDSTLYTTASMIRTMELILGLPPLTQYDAGATPMFNCFGRTARLTAYHPLTPKVNLHTRNTEKSPFARESQQMDWSEYDRIPEDELNRILWYVTKGPDVPYPAPSHRAVFTK